MMYGEWCLGQVTASIKRGEEGLRVSLVFLLKTHLVATFITAIYSFYF